MKKRALVILLCLCLCLTLCFFVACGDDEDTTPCTEHTDANNDGICDRCGAKIEKPDTPDTPDNPDQPDTPDNPDQPAKTPVTGITVSVDDEEGDGSIENPFTVCVAQGNQLQLSYAVRPNGATDKTFAWAAGTLADGVFTAADNTGLSFTDNGTRLTISASAAATFISSLMSLARTSNAPRKMPGNASTLLI